MQGSISDIVARRMAAFRRLTRSRKQVDLAKRYLDLLELTLTGAITNDVGFIPSVEGPLLADGYDEQKRVLGLDWPTHALTMIGLTRLRSLRKQVMQVVDEGIVGDFIETGVWRGGACILMRAILAAYNVKNRRVWVADSFAGLPPPNSAEFPVDTGDIHHRISYLAVSLDEVKENFFRHDLLDDQVVFLKGWFKDTLLAAPIDRLAILRLDGDMYESTMQALDSLYPKVSLGGFVVVDDYNLTGCYRAITDFRARHKISVPLEDIDGSAVFWRRTGHSGDGGG